MNDFPCCLFNFQPVLRKLGEMQGCAMLQVEEPVTIVQYGFWQGLLEFTWFKSDWTCLQVWLENMSASTLGFELHSDIHYKL